MLAKVKQAMQRMALPPLRIVKRFSRDRRGTAVEFAIVALPFFSLLISVIEIGIIFLKAEYLQSAVSEASRKIYTGQAQQAGTTPAQFKADLCAAASAMFSCGDIYVDVRTHTTYGGADRHDPVSGGNFNEGSLGYDPGARGAIVVVTAFTQHKVYLAMLASSFPKLNNGNIVLRASTAFKNEPF